LALVAVPNIANYQRSATRVEQFGDALSDGLDAEDAGDWESAATAYAAAGQYAQPDAEFETFLPRQSLQMLPFYRYAANVVDLKPLFKAMDLPADIVPGAAAAYGSGRIALILGQLNDAVIAFVSARKKDERLTFLQFDLGEAYWRDGQFRKALGLYGAAAAVKTRSIPEPCRERIVAMKRRIGEIEECTGEASVLELAALYRRFGRWPESVELYRDLAENVRGCADALYHLGVAAGLQGRNDEAVLYYERAVTALPSHYEANLQLQNR
jgi:tetratricopeptide (TPR) repeat protein